MNEHDEVTISVAEVMAAIDRAAVRFPERFRGPMRAAVLRELLYPLEVQLYRVSVEIETTKKIIARLRAVETTVDPAPTPATVVYDPGGPVEVEPNVYLTRAGP